MIDFIFGVVIGGLAVFAILHFRADPAKALTELSNLEGTIKMALQDALNELKASIDATIDKKVADAVAAVPVPDVAAAQTAQEATDEQAVRDFTTANFPAV